MKYSEKDFKEINNILQDQYGVSYVCNNINAPVNWSALKCKNPEIAIFSLNREREKNGLTLIY